MTQPAKLNFKLYQGSTFLETLRWESSTKVYTPITAITKSAPVVITAAAHNIPLGWRCRVTNVQGMKDINTPEGVYYTATDTTADTVTINLVNSVDFAAYTSGGIFEYNQPVSLDNLTARMQIREKLTSTAVLWELTTENGGIVLDDVAKTITLTIPAEDTAGMNFTSAVYSLELEDPVGKVLPFLTGAITFVKEVTRT